MWHRYRSRSFHLEALAWSIFGTTWFWKTNNSSDWASARHFFDKARDKLRWRLNDPAGFGGDVGAYLTGTALETAISKVATAYERCEHAEKAARAHEFAKMHEAYLRVFGDYYPTSWIRDALPERRR